jgi:hypothetical protein
MKRLHPIRAIREPFGTAGLVVACVAMVLALTGAAFAAKGALTGKQKKEVEKIAKKYAGKPGAPGAQGPPGPQGAAGANGKDGSNGTDGTDGTDGIDGTDGKSPEIVETLSPGEEGCDAGGVVYEAEGVANSDAVICNGSNGSPWTAGGTLPPGATETGIWSAQSSAAGAEFGIFAPVSFPIPLNDSTAPSGSMPSANVLYGEETAEPFAQSCPGSIARPKAKPGFLCVYQAVLVNTTFAKIAKVPSGPQGAFSTGAIVEFGTNTSAGGAEPAVVAGTFAVTGCDSTLPDGDPNKCP